MSAKMKQYGLEVIGQHCGSIWANRVQMGDEFGSSDNGMWFTCDSDQYNETVAVITIRPGVLISRRNEADEWEELTPDMVRAENKAARDAELSTVNAAAATQMEDCGTAQ